MGIAVISSFAFVYCLHFSFFKGIDDVKAFYRLTPSVPPDGMRQIFPDVKKWLT